MKKVSVIGAILLVIGVALVIFTMTASENPFDLGKARVEKNYTFEADDLNGTITIDEKSADIYISLSPDDQIHLKTFENEEEYYKITNNHDLTIDYRRDYEWYQKIIDLSILSEKYRYTLELSLPEELIATVEIEATNGTLSIDDIAVNDLSIHKTNGKVTLNQVSSFKDIEIDTDNGDIDLTQVTAQKDLEIHSTNGEINLNASDFGDSGFIRSTNGDVTAGLNDQGDNYTFDLSSTNKTSRIEYGNIDQEGKSLFYGNGDKLFTVDTTNGKVQVTCEP